MTAHKITSELMTEQEVAAQTIKDGNVATSKFFFKYPPQMRSRRLGSAAVGAGKAADDALEYDEDGDLILDRSEGGTILIEHSVATELKLVGLQIWRGALLLGDYILSHPEEFENKTVLELGSGVGLDSIVAAMLAKEVICTDVNLGNILKLIEKNFKRNRDLIKCKTSVTELDFLKSSWNATISRKVKDVDVVMAADVIYDDKITEGFVRTLAKLLEQPSVKRAYVALEKRFVFTIADLDSVAPMYEEFLRCVQRQSCDWSIEEIELDFPQCFRYQRLSQLLLMRIVKKT